MQFYFGDFLRFFFLLLPETAMGIEVNALNDPDSPLVGAFSE